MRTHFDGWPRWAHPAIVILAITGCFHLYRGAPFDGVVFLAVAGWLAVGATATRAPDTDPLVPPVPPRSQLWGVAAVTGVLALAPRYGPLDVLVVGALGAMAIAHAGTRRDAPLPERRGVAWPYGVVALLAAVNELTAYLLEKSPAADWRHPALSDLLNPVFDWPPTRALLVLAWLAGGLCLLRLMPDRTGRSAPLPENVGPGEPTS